MVTVAAFIGATGITVRSGIFGSDDSVRINYRDSQDLEREMTLIAVG